VKSPYRAADESSQPEGGGSIPVVPLSLAQLREGDAAVVAGLDDAGGFDHDKSGSAALIARLRDLGFVAGARCQVMARMWLGGDPLVVRIGGSTFALRRAEATAVRVNRAV
jgi:ferrous iron transport protein A